MKDNTPTFKKAGSETKTEIKKIKEITSNTIEELLQKQVCSEFGNERLYISMALWCEENGYIETAKFFMMHSLEEKKHGMDFINYMLQRKMKVNPPCEQPIEREFDGLGDLIKTALKQELKTSEKIIKLHAQALITSDLALSIASKYLTEQVEEEQLFLSLVNLYNLCGDSKIDFEMEVGHLKGKGKYKIGNL